MATTTTAVPAILTPIQPQTIQATDTTLFHLAAYYLGDVTLWNYLVLLNPQFINSDGFFDYEVTGAQTVTLPLPGTFVSNGGILNAFPTPAGGLPAREFNNDFDYAFQ